MTEDPGIRPEESEPEEEDYGDDPSLDEHEDELPELSDEPDNDPDDDAEYQEPDEVQDAEGTERPETDKHPEEE